MVPVRGTKEGIEAARARGKHLGRPAVEMPKDWDAVHSQWKDGKLHRRPGNEDSLADQEHVLQALSALTQRGVTRGFLTASWKRIVLFLV